jgi:hypothetical protein
MVTPRTLLFFDPMFRDPESLDGEIDHLAPLWHAGLVGTQIMVAMLTALNWMNDHLIGGLDPDAR